jgi:hypothetical protein
MDNPTVWICGLLCGVPAFVTLTIHFTIRAFAKRHPTIHIERTRIPLPDAAPDVNRLAIYFDLPERPIGKVEPEEDEE